MLQVKDQPRPVAIYARVSKPDQTSENQLRQLRTYVERRPGWSLCDTYEDTGSGADLSRAEHDRLMADARMLKFSVVVVWKFDRFARSTKHLLDVLDQFRHLGIDFCSLHEQIDTSTPAGKLFFTLIAAIAEFERDMIIQRVKAGLDRARAEGKRLGRPPIEVDVDKITSMRAQGFSIRAIAEEMGISKSKVGKLVKGACGSSLLGAGHHDSLRVVAEGIEDLPITEECQTRPVGKH